MSKKEYRQAWAEIYNELGDKSKGELINIILDLRGDLA